MKLNKDYVLKEAKTDEAKKFIDYALTEFEKEPKRYTKSHFMLDWYSYDYCMDCFYPFTPKKCYEYLMKNNVENFKDFVNSKSDYDMDLKNLFIFTFRKVNELNEWDDVYYAFNDYVRDYFDELE